MKNKVLLAIVALSYVPVAFGGNDAAYPSEKLAEFVVAKLEVNSLPSAFRPRKEKGKKTFADYGFKAQTGDENEAIVEAPSGGKAVKIKVLDQKPSGISVCIAAPEQNKAETNTQSVVLLKQKDPHSLLKGRQSFREYTACPVIGGSDSTADSYGGY